MRMVLVYVPRGHVGHHVGRQRRRPEGVHKEVDQYFLGNEIHHLFVFF